MTLKLRLTVWYSGLLAGALLVFGIIVYAYISWSMLDEVRDTVKQKSNAINVTGTVFLNTFDLNVDRNSDVDGKNIYVQLVNYKKSVYNQTGVRRSSSLIEKDFYIPYPTDTADLANEHTKEVVEIGGQKYNMIVYQQPLYYNNEIVGLLQVGALTYYEEQVLGAIRNILLLCSLLVVFIAFIGGLFIARRALRPVEQVISSTKQIESGSDLSVRIAEPKTNDEIGTLVNTLNLMLSRLERAYNELDDAYKAQRRFVSDASHELRTPLTTIRGNIDLIEKMWIKASEEKNESQPFIQLSEDHFELSFEAITDITAEAKRMSTLVNDLLALARADAGYTMEKKEVDIYHLTEGIVRRAQLLPRQSEWIIGDLSALRDHIVYGNEDYLQQLLFIFIENAFKYTDEGQVKFNTYIKDQHVVWKIEDSGIGMKQDEIPYIFDRFYRADESRGIKSGTGLGLAIAKWIIEEHNGSVEVETLESEGTTFTIWLPLYNTSQSE